MRGSFAETRSNPAVPLGNPVAIGKEDDKAMLELLLDIVALEDTFPDIEELDDNESDEGKEVSPVRVRVAEFELSEDDDWNAEDVGDEEEAAADDSEEVVVALTIL